MAPVALAFAVLEVTDSPSALGHVLAANSIPMVAFLLFGGVIADRLPRVLVCGSGSVCSRPARARSRCWSSPTPPRCG